MSPYKVVNCPNCSKRVEWKKDNEFRPFCCERCKLIDFGEWATEKNLIAGESITQPIDIENENIQ